MARPYEIAKCSWLYRQSSVLKRWKKNWFVLYQNGDLQYFDSPDSRSPEESVVVRAECTNILSGKQIDGVIPPENKTKEHLIQLKLRTGEMTLCAESLDDMRAWQLLLEDARIMRNAPPAYMAMGAPPPYPGQPPTAPTQFPGQPGMVPPQYPGQTLMAPPQHVVYPSQANATTVTYPRQQYPYSYPGQVVYAAGQAPYVYPGNQTTIVYTDNEYRRRHGLNGDMATGFVAGAALGTMMWTPMLFW